MRCHPRCCWDGETRETKWTASPKQPIHKLCGTPLERQFGRQHAGVEGDGSLAQLIHKIGEMPLEGHYRRRLAEEYVKRLRVPAKY